MSIRWFDTEATFEIAQNNGQGFRLLPEPGSQPGSFRGIAQQEHQTGLVAGAFEGDKIAFRIRWGDGKVGGYHGYLFPDGRLRGATSRLDGAAVSKEITTWSTVLAIFGIAPDRPPGEIEVGWWSMDGYYWAR